MGQIHCKVSPLSFALLHSMFFPVDIAAICLPPKGAHPTLVEIQTRKRNEQVSRLSIHPEWHLKATLPVGITDVTTVAHESLSESEWKIVVQDGVSLQAAFREGRYTAVEVAKAFFHAAVVAHQLTNCLTEIFFDEGLTRAEELDRSFKQTGRLVGRLHGLPISIKDALSVRGQDASSGYAGLAGNMYAESDAVIVNILRKAGAVIFAKTAVPQTLMSLETSNQIYGRTLNPYNIHLTAGGSSGGESALVALHGSVMGVGTDIGGSVRVPAAHCGLYGLKPSNGRIPRAGLCGTRRGMDAIISSLGPLTRSARDLALFMDAVLAGQPWLIEPAALEIPWRPFSTEGQDRTDTLSVAILWDDGVVHPHPPITHALAEAEAALIKAGHDVIRWELLSSPNHQEARDLICKLYFLDGAEQKRQIMRDGHDPLVPQTEFILGFGPDVSLSPSEVWDAHAERDAFRTALLAHWLATASRTNSGRPVDVVLSPVAPTLAPPHDTTRWWGYSSYWNLADYPGVVFPMHPNVDLDPAPMPPARNAAEEFVHKQWGPKTYTDAPISLQLVARRLNEEKLLHALSLVEGAIDSSRA